MHQTKRHASVRDLLEAVLVGFNCWNYILKRFFQWNYTDNYSN